MCAVLSPPPLSTGCRRRALLLPRPPDLLCLPGAHAHPARCRLPTDLSPPGRKLEDQVDRKTAELIALRKAAMESNSKAAVRDAALESAAEGGSGGGDWEIRAGLGGGQQQQQQQAQAQARWQQQGPQPVAGELAYGGGCGNEGSSPLGQQRYGSGEFGSDGGSAAVDALQRQLEELQLAAERQQAVAAERETGWQQHAEALQAQVAYLQQRQEQQQLQHAAQQQQQQPASGAGPQAARLAAQCDALSKERDALRTIMDSKVRVLVDDIGRSMAELPPEVGAQACFACTSVCCLLASVLARLAAWGMHVLPELAPQPAHLCRPNQPSIRPTLLLMLPSSSTAPPLPPVQAQVHPKLGKQVDYLGKLVRATVQAMAVQQGAAQ